MGDGWFREHKGFYGSISLNVSSFVHVAFLTPQKKTTWHKMATQIVWEHNNSCCTNTAVEMVKTSKCTCIRWGHVTSNWQILGPTATSSLYFLPASSNSYLFPPPGRVLFLLPARVSCLVLVPSSRIWLDIKRVPFLVWTETVITDFVSLGSFVNLWSFIPLSIMLALAKCIY